MAPSHISFETRVGGLRWSLASGILVMVFAAPVYSQSLGDVARQERERKDSQPTHSTHVYTNEDLAKPKILVPEDQARVTKEKIKPAPSERAPETASKESQEERKDAAVPLGEIARRYRGLKEASRKAEPPAPQRELHTQTLAYPKFAPRTAKPTANPAANPAPLAPVRVEKNNLPVTAQATHPEETIEKGRIRVQPGDTLWKLAKEYLGRGENWPMVAGVNPQVADPSLILAGTWVRLPDKPDRPAETSVATKVRSVQVGRGDTLWKLTQEYFGDGAEWACVARANPKIKNSNLIFAGQMLTMPEDCAAAPGRGLRASAAPKQ